MEHYLDLWVPDGHHQTMAVRLLVAAGLLKDTGESAKRKYTLATKKSWLRARLARPAEIAVAVSRGETDVGICGWDWILETGRSCVPILNLGFGRVSWKLLVPEEWKHIATPEDLLEQECNHGLLVWSELPNSTREFFKDLPLYKEMTRFPPTLQLFPWHEEKTASPVTVRLSHGKTEIKEVCVDAVSTGNTARANGKKDIATVLEESTAWLVASHQAMSNESKAKRVSEIKVALREAVRKRKICDQNESQVV